MITFKFAALAGAAALMIGAAVVSVHAKDHGYDDEDYHRSPIERICSSKEDHPEPSQRFQERFAERLSLTDAQKASWKDLADTRAKARSDFKTSLCADKPDLSTLQGRLSFREKILENRLAAVKAENPKLLAFYNSLDASQKEKFDRFSKRRWHRHDDDDREGWHHRGHHHHDDD